MNTLCANTGPNTTTATMGAGKYTACAGGKMTPP